ncbi:MAG: Mrp/NBP35 family ATP-binding protein [Candidatus Baldrarchaeia archaeon]
MKTAEKPNKEQVGSAAPEKAHPKIKYVKGRIIVENEKIMKNMERIKHPIAIMSGKGGVGKTTVAVNLAIALAWRGYVTGILDADIHGPDVPKMMGLEGQRPVAVPNGILPVFGPLNIKVMSMEFLLEKPDVPIIWRGPLKMRAIEQFLSDVIWGDLDFLIIDLPPGTGDEPLSIMQLIPNLEGVIIVTTPQEVALLDVSKAIMMAKRLNVRVLGVIENMAGFVCPHCGKKTNIFGYGGGENAAKEYNIPFLGRLPLDPRIMSVSDRGRPFIIENPDSEASKAFMEIVKNIEKEVGELSQ